MNMQQIKDIKDPELKQRAFILEPNLWPLWPVLPMKRTGGTWEVGFILGDPEVEEDPFQSVVSFCAGNLYEAHTADEFVRTTILELWDAGWRVD